MSFETRWEGIEDGMDEVMSWVDGGIELSLVVRSSSERPTKVRTDRGRRGDKTLQCLPAVQVPSQVRCRGVGRACSLTLEHNSLFVWVFPPAQYGTYLSYLLLRYLGTYITLQLSFTFKLFRTRDLDSTRWPLLLAMESVGRTSKSCSRRSDAAADAPRG